MSSEQLADGVNPLDAELAATWDVLKGYSGRDTDLGIGRRFGGATMAFSLRDVGAMNGAVVRVRRDSDDTEEDFSANQVASGALETFVQDGATQRGLTQTEWQNTGGESFSSTSTDGFSYSNSSGTAFIGVTLSETLAFGDSVFISFNASGITHPTSSDQSPQVRLRDSVSGGDGASPINQVVNGFNAYTLTYNTVGKSNGDNIVFSEGDTAGGTVTISDFKVFGVSRNGFVETWYDQSGNGFDLKSQSADTQPFIVSNGGFTGGVYSPSRTSNSTKQYLEVSSPDFDCTDITSSKFGWLAVMANMEENVNGGAGVIFGNTKNTQTYPTGAIGLQLSDTNEGRMFVMNSRTGSAADFIGAVDDTDLFDSETIGTAVVDGSSLNTFLNGSTASGTFTSLTLTSSFNFKIFQSTSSVGGLSYTTASQGFIKELMFMQGDTINDIATIRNEVNNHYNIF